MFILEVDSVLVATGSACAANSGTRSSVLTAIGLADDVADGSIRLTLGRGTTEESVTTAAERIIAAVEREATRTGVQL